MRKRSFLSHAAQAITEGALVALIVVGLIAGTALAGKGGGAAGGAVTSSFRVDNGTFAGVTLAHRGSSGAVWVHAKCFQGGALVYEQWRKYVGDTTELSLGPTPLWHSGSANCTAEEGSYGRNNRWRASSSTTFSVSG